MGAVGTVASSDESGRARKRPKTASFTSQAHNKDESVRTNPGTKSQHHKPTADSKKAFGNSKAIESLGGGNLRSGSSDQGRSMTRFTTSLVETGFPTVNRNDNQIGSSPTHGQLHPLRSATSLAQSLKNMPTMEPSGTNLPSQTGETLTDTALLHRLNPASQNQPTISDMTAAILHDRSQGRHTTRPIPHSIFDHLLTGISEPSSSTRVAAAIATGAGYATAAATMGRQLSSNLDPGIFQLYETTHSQAPSPPLGPSHAATLQYYLRAAQGIGMDQPGGVRGSSNNHNQHGPFTTESSAIGSPPMGLDSLFRPASSTTNDVSSLLLPEKPTTTSEEHSRMLRSVANQIGVSAVQLSRLLVQQQYNSSQTRFDRHGQSIPAPTTREALLGNTIMQTASPSSVATRAGLQNSGTATQPQATQPGSSVAVPVPASAAPVLQTTTQVTTAATCAFGRHNESDVSGDG